MVAAKRDYTLSDNEIRDSIISLITAGYETTSGALAWAIYTLLTLPGAWDTAADEVHRVAAATTADRGRPRRADLPQRRRARDASAVLSRSDLRPQGDARPPVRRAPHPRGSVADLQRRMSPTGCPSCGPNQREFRPQRWDPGIGRTTASPRRTSSSRSAGGCTAASERSWPPPR